MNIKRVLVIVLVILLLVAGISTLLGVGNNNSAPKGNVSIAATGDVMFARNMAGVLSYDSSPFAGVSNVTSRVDMLIINFENAATTHEGAIKGDIPFKCDPSYVPLAKANNNTVATLANNHVTDYGVVGLNDTLNHLDDAGIARLGAGLNEEEAHSQVTKEINGRNITILNYMDSNNFAEYAYESLPYANGSNPGYSAYDSADAQKRIAEARNTSDFIIVCMHFGNEYAVSPNEDQTRIAHELIDYGADTVIGAHPHVPQGIEMYNGKAIFYSLGNFIFDLANPDTVVDYMVELDLVNDTCECTVYPVYIYGYLPQFMDESNGEAMLNSLSPQCSEMKIENGVGKLSFNLTES